MPDDPDWKKKFAVVTLTSVALFFVILFGAQAMLNRTVAKAIQNEAVDHSVHVTRDVQKNFPEIERIARESRAEISTLDNLRTYFRLADGLTQIKIYDPDGVLRYVYDEDLWISQGGHMSNPEIEHSLEHGTSIYQPLEFAVGNEAPLVVVRSVEPAFDADGKLIAFLEVTMDHSDAALVFRSAFDWLTVALPILMALSYFVPTVSWLFLKSRHGRTERMVHHLSRRDPLTGLMNRATFTEEAYQVFKTPATAPFQHGLMIVDINQFRSVNEVHGHRVGDAFLCHVADILQRALREDDLVARFNGDEFVAVLPQVLPEELSRAANRVRTQLRRQFQCGDIKLTCHACIGTHLATPYDTLDDAMQAADLALTHAKKSGTDLVVAYSADLDRKRARRRKIEAALRDAWDNDRAHLVFQPVIDARNRRIAGFETLMRLTTEDGEPVSPAEFIPIAEQTGLIRELGRITIQRALQTALSWPQDTFLAINLSPAQFRHGDLVDDVQWLIDTTGFPPERLEFEITESLLLDEEPEVRAQFNGLRALGISIAMDDFGTGYSSLSYLLAHDFDKLKIDRTFLEDLGSNPARQRKILKSIIDLGQQIGLAVTMEGVETADQVDMLDALGCDLFQGFYFSRPVAETEVSDILARETGGAA